MRNTKKIVAIVLAAVLLVSAVAVGTLAWLMSKPEAITNTFTVGDVEITLTETGAVDGAKAYTGVMPGDTIAKDPTVTVKAGSAACYLFVEVNNNTNGVVTANVDKSVWTEASGLTAKTTGATVYYKVINDATESDTEYAILTDNQVTVSDSFTGGEIGNIVFTAYAIQKANIDSYQDAWTNLG